jgi:hypothetical protein
MLRRDSHVVLYSLAQTANNKLTVGGGLTVASPTATIRTADTSAGLICANPIAAPIELSGMSLTRAWNTTIGNCRIQNGGFQTLNGNHTLRVDSSKTLSFSAVTISANTVLALESMGSGATITSTGVSGSLTISGSGLLTVGKALSLIGMSVSGAGRMILLPSTLPYLFSSGGTYSMSALDTHGNRLFVS